MRRILLILLATAALLAVTVQPVKAAVLEYDCNPSSTGWDVVGQWADGSVMERRVCIRADTTAHRVSSYSYWRTRKGGTPILSDWNLTDTTAFITSITTGNQYGWRDNYGDAFDTSFITISSYWGCSGQGGTQSYYAGVAFVQANPNGSLPASGFKSGSSFTATDNFIDCTP